MGTNLVTLKAVCKSYALDDVRVSALKDVDLTIRSNRFTVISGASGSGKTTLLNLIGALDRPDCGEIEIAGHRIQEMSDDALSDFRARNLGFVFQGFNLLPVLSAYENVEYPLLLTRTTERMRQRRVVTLLSAVGLIDKAHHRPGQLSGGQRQRVAIARALATAPKLVLADEPTANLDSRTGAAVIALMREVQRQHGISFVISSHDPQLLAEADDGVKIQDGRIAEVTRQFTETSSHDHTLARAAQPVA